MSHFSVLVLTESDGNVEPEVTRLLAPYDENGTWFREGSRWDWWEIGGRWTGHLDPAYDPYKDPINYEPCKWCDATGTTTQSVADKYPAYQENVGKPCIQCNQTEGDTPPFWPGHQLKFHLESQDSDAGMPVALVIERGITPTFAVVTPDGEWHERGQMGWFGMASNEKEQDEWTPEWQRLLKAWPDAYATIVDCHV